MIPRKGEVSTDIDVADLIKIEMKIRITKTANELGLSVADSILELAAIELVKDAKIVVRPTPEKLIRSR
jgi:hypothetical protein